MHPKIIYLPWCHSKTEWLSFFCEAQKKIFRRMFCFGYRWLWTKNTANYLLSYNNTKLTFSEWVCMCPDTISDTFLFYGWSISEVIEIGFAVLALLKPNPWLRCACIQFFIYLFKIKTDAKVHSHRELFSFSSMGVSGIVPQGAKHNTVSIIPHLAWRD